MSRDDGMDEHGIERLYNGCLYQAGFGLEIVGPIITMPNFLICPDNKSDPQHDSHSHGPDDGSKTIDYHHLGMSRDDGMDDHGLERLYGYRLSGFGLGSWPNNHHAAKFPHALTTNLTRSMTHMGQMMAPKPLIIII
jgi:hypothetical protein